MQNPTTPGQMPGPTEVEELVIKQRITPLVNRYEIRRGDRSGPLLALAQQKRFAFKEQVTFYADEAKTQPMFSFRARRKLDFSAGYDVTDHAGQAVGWFRKDFGKSLLRSTWHVGVPWQGLEGSGQERSRNVALARRFLELIPIIGEVPIPWVFHFDFTAADGTPILSSTKRWGITDFYTVTLPAAGNGDRMDWRVAAAVGVALDALQDR